MEQVPDFAAHIRARATTYSGISRSVAELRLAVHAPMPASVRQQWEQLDAPASQGAAAALRDVAPAISELQNLVTIGAPSAKVERSARAHFERLEAVPARSAWLTAALDTHRGRSDAMLSQSHSALISAAKSALQEVIRTAAQPTAINELASLDASTKVPFWKRAAAPLETYYNAMKSAKASMIVAKEPGLADWFQADRFSRRQAQEDSARRSAAVIRAAREDGLRLPSENPGPAQLEDWGIALEAMNENDIVALGTWVPPSTFFYNDPGLGALIANGKTLQKVAGVIGYPVTEANKGEVIESLSATGEIERRTTTAPGDWVVRDPDAVIRSADGRPNRWVIQRARTDINKRYRTDAGVRTSQCEDSLDELYLPPQLSYVRAIDNDFGPLLLVEETGLMKYADLAGGTSALACDLLGNNAIDLAIRTIPNPDRRRFIDRTGAKWLPPAYVEVDRSFANASLADGAL